MNNMLWNEDNSKSFRLLEWLRTFKGKYVFPVRNINYCTQMFLRQSLKNHDVDVVASVVFL